MVEFQNLESLYAKFKHEVRLSEELTSRLSPPLLLYPTSRWNEARARVLIVGQETLGWDFFAGSYFEWPYPEISTFKDFMAIENSVEAMMHGYKVFEYSRHQPVNYRSPFWRAYRQIRRNFDIEVDGIETAVLWSNLFRMSLDGGSVVKYGKREEIDSLKCATAGLLKSEIEILKPNIVLFFTGPNYNEALYSEFEDIELINFEGHDQSKTSWLKQHKLPDIALRTYHPGYLNRGNWQLIDQIEQAIVEKAHN